MPDNATLSATNGLKALIKKQGELLSRPLTGCCLILGSHFTVLLLTLPGRLSTPYEIAFMQGEAEEHPKKKRKTKSMVLLAQHPSPVQLLRPTRHVVLERPRYLLCRTLEPAAYQGMERRFARLHNSQGVSDAPSAATPQQAVDDAVRHPRHPDQKYASSSTKSMSSLRDRLQGASATRKSY